MPPMVWVIKIHLSCKLQILSLGMKFREEMLKSAVGKRASTLFTALLPY